MNTFPIERRAANRVPPAPSTRDAFGLRAAADAVLQHGWLALGVFVLVFGVAVAYLLLTPPIYTADTLLQIDSRPRTTVLPNAPGADRGSADGERLAISGEIEILRSREVLMPVISATGVDVEVGGARRYGFLPAGARHGVDVAVFIVPERYREVVFGLRVQAGRWALAEEDGPVVAEGNVGEFTQFTMPGGNAWITVLAEPALPETELKVRLRNELKAYEDVLKRLRTFEPSRESNVVRISYEDRHPERAAALLNWMVASYVTRSVKRRSDEDAKALAYLEQQLPPLKAEVEAAEDALSQEQNQTRATPLTTEADALLRQRGDLERQLTELRIKRDLLSQTYTPEHPDLAAVLAQIATVQSAAGRLSGSVRQLPVQQRDMVRLQRNVQVSTELYTSMLTRVQQLRLNGASGLSTARQLDWAAIPVEPARPKPVALLSIGAGMGLLLSLGAVLLARALQPTVSDAQELESPASLPTLAVIPESEAQHRLMEGRLKEEVIEDLGTHRLLVHAAPEDPASESLRSVNLSLMLRARTMAAKVILITSPSAGTGKAFIASNLAALMAENGKRVLLIEADLRKPGIHKFVGLDETAPGLADLLADQRTLDDILNTHSSVPIDVILRGKVSGNPGSLLMSSALDTAMAELRDRYDHIVINAAPLLPSGDALAIGRLVDIALLVVRAEQSLLHETRVAQRRLEQAGIKLEGLLFNGVKRKRLNAPVLT